mgnify:CR=1 FL=1
MDTIRSILAGAVLVGVAVCLAGCGAAAKIEGLQQQVNDLEQRRRVAEEEAAARLADLQATAVAELEASKRAEQRLLDELDARGEPVAKAPSGLAQFVPPERVVIHTITNEVPVVKIDGNLDAVQESSLEEELNAWRARYSSTQQRVAEISTALEQAEKVLASYRDQPPLEKYGPPGLGGIALTLLGYLLGWWRRQRQAS